MNDENVQAFLDYMLMDQEDTGLPSPKRPGFVEYQGLSLLPEDMDVREYDEREWEEGGLTCVDTDSHLPAADAVMQILLRMRRYWRDTTEVETPADALTSWASDIKEVSALLGRFRGALLDMAKGEAHLETNITQSREELRMAQITMARAKNAVTESERKLNSSIRARNMFRLLNEGPVEQLARVAESQSTSTEAQEPEANV